MLFGYIIIEENKMINNITINGLVNNLKLKNINVLIGDNNSGKSLLLKKIAKQYKEKVFYYDSSRGLSYPDEDLYYIKKDYLDVYENIINTIKLVLPNWDGENFNLSYGSLNFINLVVILLQPNRPKIICLDNPELGLHFYAINILGALLQSVSGKTQIITATQSKTLLDEFNLEDIIMVKNKNGKFEYNRLNNAKDYEGWLKEYTVSELWYKNILGNCYL
jgi:predicted ATPase